MTNFSAKILNNAVGALSAQQAVIASTANNIANVNTPGYARRTIDLQTRVTRGNGGVIDVGNGVEIGRVNRIIDLFVERQLRAAKSDQGAAAVQDEFIGRLERLFPLDGSADTIGSTLTGFFSAVNDLASNPSSIELRRNYIAAAEDLTTTIANTFNSIADLQTEADQRIGTQVQNINSYTSQIAELNGLIAAREGASRSVAGDERDRREQLLQQLTEIADVRILDQEDGSVSISLPNGFSLVSGSRSASLSVTESPSFASGALPPSLNGGVLRYIVYDYDTGAGESHVDLTQEFSGGSLGGLLSLRGYNAPSNTSAFQGSGTLVEAASRIEALTRQLLTTFNQTYRGPDRLSGTVGYQPSAGDLNGNNPGVFGMFTVAGVTDADADGLAEATDLAASGIDSFAGSLSLTTTNPRAIAAARDASGGAVTAVYPTGDGSNMRAIAAMQTTDYTFALGSYSFTGTYDGSYNELVTKVGNDKSRAAINLKVADASLEAAQNRRDEVSAVSLDEEFTKLIQFQKSYQASARLVRVGEELLDQILQLL